MVFYGWNLWSLYEILFSVTGIPDMLQVPFHEMLNNSLNPRLNFWFEKEKDKNKSD